MLGEVTLSPNGTTTAKMDGIKVWLWETDTGKERGPLPSTDRVHLRTFSPDGKLLATQTRGKGGRYNIDIWDAGTVKERQTLQTPKVELCNAAFTWDGRRMAGISKRSTRGLGGVRFDLFLWDVASGRLIERKEDLHHLNGDALNFSLKGK